MLILTILILIATFIIIFFERRYFRQQRGLCQKYPFFRLRDEIIWKIATADDHTRYLEIYDVVNSVMGRLKYFNFGFYSDIMSTAFNKILEKAYNRDFELDDELLNQIKEEELTPFHGQLIKLILETAKENSLLLRASMSNLGYKILFTTHLIKAVIKFLRKHPEAFKKRRDHVKTMRNYSYMNHLVDRLEFSQ